jgi:hypothetical protein
MATLTVKQSGGDYTTLAAAVAAAANGDTIEISGTWTADESTSTTIAVTALDLTIQAVGDSKCNGQVSASTGHYRLRYTGTGYALEHTDNYGTLIIDGLEIILDSETTSTRLFYGTPSGGNLTVIVQNCLLYATNSVAGQRGINIQNNSITRATTLNVINSIFFGFGRSAIYQGSAYTSATGVRTVNINSCTVYGCGSIDEIGGIEFRDNNDGCTSYVNIFNTISMDNTGDDYAISGDYSGNPVWDIHNSIASDTSIASRDASASGCLASRTATDSASPGTGDWVIFEDKTNNPVDLRLKNNATDNDAQQMHTSGSGAGLTMPTTDIAGTNRPQVTNYDCGAFEVVSVSGPATPTNLQGTPTANSILWSWEAG